jgi:hypothetical protein
MPVRLDLFQRRLVFLSKHAAGALARVRNQVSFGKAVFDGQIKLVAGRLLYVEATLADNGFQNRVQVQCKLLFIDWARASPRVNAPERML